MLTWRHKHNTVNACRLKATKNSFSAYMIGSRWQQVKQGFPKTFQGQVGYVNPASFRSAPKSPTGWTCSENHPGGMLIRCSNYFSNSFPTKREQSTIFWQRTTPSDTQPVCFKLCKPPQCVLKVMGQPGT